MLNNLGSLVNFFSGQLNQLAEEVRRVTFVRIRVVDVSGEPLVGAKVTVGEATGRRRRAAQICVQPVALWQRVC